MANAKRLPISYRELPAKQPYDLVRSKFEEFAKEQSLALSEGKVNDLSYAESKNPMGQVPLSLRKGFGLFSRKNARIMVYLSGKGGDVKVSGYMPLPKRSILWMKTSDKILGKYAAAIDAMFGIN